MFPGTAASVGGRDRPRPDCDESDFDCVDWHELADDVERESECELALNHPSQPSLWDV